MLLEDLWLCKCSLKKIHYHPRQWESKKELKPYLILSQGLDYNFSFHNLGPFCFLKKGDYAVICKHLCMLTSVIPGFQQALGFAVSGMEEAYSGQQPTQKYTG